MKSLGIELSLSSSREGQLPTCDGDEALAVGHFSQVNEAGNAVLQTLVKSCFTSGEDILDLYAGAGNFSFPLAEMGCKVRAVEVDPVLVKNGKQIAAGLALSGSIEFFESSCERYVTREKIPPAVLLDPPRAGAKGVVVNLDPKRTRKIVYVSCNLPSLSRDLGILVEKGYVLERVSVVDMFSQTHHVETVSILRADTTS